MLGSLIFKSISKGKKHGAVPCIHLIYKIMANCIEMHS